MSTAESATREQLARWRRAGGKLRVLKLGGSLLDWAEWPAALRAWRREDVGRARSAVDASVAFDLIVVGGGAWCDALRESDRRFGLGDEFCHRACLELMTITARLAWRVLAGAPAEVESPLASFASTVGWLSDLEFISASSAADASDASVPDVRASDTIVLAPDAPDASVLEVGHGARSCLAAGRPGPWAVVDAGRWLANRDGTAGGLLPATWEVSSDSIAAWVATEVGAGELVLFKSLSADGGGAIAEWSARGWVDSYFPRMAARLGGRGVRLVGLRGDDRNRERVGPNAPEGETSIESRRVS